MSADVRDRTADLGRTKTALFQLSYDGVCSEGVEPSLLAAPGFEPGMSPGFHHEHVELGAEDSKPYDCGQNAAACPVSRAPIESDRRESNPLPLVGSQECHRQHLDRAASRGIEPLSPG